MAGHASTRESIYRAHSGCSFGLWPCAARRLRRKRRRAHHFLLPGSAVGIRWRKKIIGSINTHLINQLLTRVRNSALARADYDRVADFFSMAFFTPAEFLPGWEEWRTIADRYRRDMRHSWSLLAAAVSQPISGGVRAPFELADIEAAALEQLMASLDNRYVVRDFWRSDRLDAATASSGPPLFPSPNDVDNSGFRRAIKRRRKELSRCPQNAPDGSSRLRLPDNYGPLGPIARIRAIRESRQTSPRVGRITRTGLRRTS